MFNNIVRPTNSGSSCSSSAMDIAKIIKQQQDSMQKLIQEQQQRQKMQQQNFNNTFKLPSVAPISFGNIFKQQLEEQKKIAQLQKNIENGQKQIQNLFNQINNLQKVIKQRDDTIRQRDTTILQKNKRITYLTKENTRLKRKNNSLLDHLQYFRSQLFGNESVTGYKDTVVKQQIENDNLKKQEIGEPIYKKKDEIAVTHDSNVSEGFVNSGSATYNALYTQNQAVQNKIDDVKNKQSVDNQLSVNISSKINTLQSVNFILICIFIIAIIFGCYKLFLFPGMNMRVKIGIVIIMILSISLIHSIEYLLFHLVPYVWSLITTTPYEPNYNLALPGIYDYLTSV
jgi:chromosome segregation ATPase